MYNHSMKTFSQLASIGLLGIGLAACSPAAQDTREGQICYDVTSQYDSNGILPGSS